MVKFSKPCHFYHPLNPCLPQNPLNARVHLNSHLLSNPWNPRLQLNTRVPSNPLTPQNPRLHQNPLTSPKWHHRLAQNRRLSRPILTKFVKKKLSLTYPLTFPHYSPLLTCRQIFQHFFGTVTLDNVGRATEKPGLFAPIDPGLATMITLILISLTLLTIQLAVLAFIIYVLIVHGSDPRRTDSPPPIASRKAQIQPNTWVLTDAAMAELERELKRQRADQAKPNVPYR
jgi:hypothetical protein